MPRAGNTYEAVGNKIDMGEIITNIAPYDTPLHTRLPKTKATATYHEWLEDTLDEATPNFWPEGTTYVTHDGEARVRLGNPTQIMQEGIQVTATQEVVAKYGVGKESAYQLRKTLKKLAMDCELALITQDTRDFGNMGTPRKFGGLPYWIVTNRLDNGGTPRPLTLDLINSALEMTWRQGGRPTLLLVSPTNKRVVSTFTAGSTKYMEGNKTHTLSQYIDVIETDFGRLQVLVDMFMPNDRIYGISPEYLKEAVLRPFKDGDMPKLSDAVRKYIVGEWTLEMRAEKAHFCIEDLDGIVPVP